MAAKQTLVRGLLTLLAFWTLVKPARAESTKGTDNDGVTIPLNMTVSQIETITIPSSWKIDGPQSFSKCAKDLWDCDITLWFGYVSLPSDRAMVLQTHCYGKSPTKQELDMLKLFLDGKITCPSDDPCKATTFDINGKRAVLLERRGRDTSPCQPIGEGKSRMPRLNYSDGVGFLIDNTYHLDEFGFRAHAMGDIEPCVERIKNVLKSIKWTK